MNRACINNSCFGLAAVVAVMSLSCRGRGPDPPVSTAPLESNVEAELFRVEEAYRLLAFIAQQLNNQIQAARVHAVLGLLESEGGTHSRD